MKYININSSNLIERLRPNKTIGNMQICICSLDELSSLLQDGLNDLEHSFAIVVATTSVLSKHGDLLNKINHVAADYPDIYWDFADKAISPEVAKVFAENIMLRKKVRYWYFVSEKGVQRSPAIACAALGYWKKEKEELSIWGDSTKIPNEVVYLRMCRALGVPISNKRFSKRFDLNQAAIKNLTDDEIREMTC